MNDDDFFEALARAMMKPIPREGDRVTVDGRPGVIVEIRTPYTCSCCYVVDHDGEVVEHWHADFWLTPRENPVIEVIPSPQSS